MHRKRFVASGCLVAAVIFGINRFGIGQEQNPPPNIVIMLADDLGYGDVSCYNPDRGKISTPSIDRLAAEGMRFTDGHSSSAVCSPSRYTLLTGRYHWRTRLQKGIVGLWGPPLIDEDRQTIGTLLQRHGYATACIGKWHLGWDWPIHQDDKRLYEGPRDGSAQVTAQHTAAWHFTFSQPIPGGPVTRGFDEYFGTDVPNWPPFCFVEQNRVIGMPSTFLPRHLFLNNLASRQGPAIEDWSFQPILPRLADRVCEFISRQSQARKPFFVYLPLTSPHTPIAVNREWQGRSRLGGYADFVMETDGVVGQVLDAVDRNGIANNTLVVFTSDNGCAPVVDIPTLEAQGHFPSGPLRGHKSDVWEGGHRVPFIVRWPSQVRANSVCHHLVHQADLFATCAAAAGVTFDDSAGEDSFNLLSSLTGSGQPVREHAVSQSSQGLVCIRRGGWKLILGPGSGGWSKGRDELPAQLYDLESDLGEKRNLFSQRPDQVAELTKLMDQLVRDGRSTEGDAQANDQPFDWQRFMTNAAEQ